MKRRAQIQMGETIVIVIIVMLLIVFGFVIYTRWAQASLKVSSQSAREMDAYAIASVVANLPELHCSRNNVIEQNCYDTLKIAAMTRLINESRAGYYCNPPNSDGHVDCPAVTKDSFFHYQSLFKNTKIVVYEVYPLVPGANPSNVSDSPFHYIVYDNPPAEILQKIPARIPIILYDSLTEDARFGMIEVVRYY